ncbi:MAG: ABC transporter ATP-binding protein [Phycisphaerales bacterium]
MLTIRDVHKSYGDVQALRGVTLECARGEILALLGPNGAGKSTTVGVATGLLAPDSGSVELLGVGSPRLARVRRHLGVAPQSIAVYEDLSAAENLRFFGRMYRLPASVLRDREAMLLDRVGLTHRAGEPVQHYSGGMKRRLNLAIALIHDPEVVLLDEPTAGVDPQSRNAILELVRELGDEGKAVVYSTHYMEEAQRISDRVAILDHGRVMATGAVDELISAHGGDTRVRRDSPAGTETVQTKDPLPTLAGMLAEPETRAIHVDRPDLEAVFLNLTGRSLRDT